MRRTHYGLVANALKAQVILNWVATLQPDVMRYAVPLS
jgi:hypothetical protein